MIAFDMEEVDRDRVRLVTLSRTEREVVEQLADGYSIPEIAKLRCISPNTVKGHLRASFDKLEVRSQQKLIVRVWKVKYQDLRNAAWERMS